MPSPARRGGDGERRSPRRGLFLRQALGAALASLVVVAALAVGTVHRLTLILVVPSALAVAWLAWRLDAERGGRGVRASRDLLSPSLCLLALAAVTALQALPLPMGVLRVLAPRNADVWARALMPFDGVVGWGTISLDPGASLTEALKLCVYAAAFLGAATLTAHPSSRLWPVVIVFGSAVAVALVTSAHDLAGATRLYGMYEPRNPVEPRHMGPFLNPNNLAGYLNLGVFCGLGLLLARDRLLPRWAVGIGVAVLVGVVIRSASRGGVVALFVGACLLAAILLRTRGRSTWRERASLLIPAAALVSGVVLAWLGGTFGIWNELFQDNVSKLRVLPATLPLIGDFKWLGIGRGAFESVFAAYHLAPAPNVLITHPENFIVQWIAEWGVLGGALVLAGLGWLLRPGPAGVARSGLALGLWCGAVALLFHNLGDLGIEIPGVAMAFVVVLGSIWGGSRRMARSPRGWPAWVDRRALFVAFAGMASLLVIGIAARRHLRDVRAERAYQQELFERTANDASRRSASWNELRGAMLRHPADYYFPLLGAAMAWKFNDRSPIPWIQRALERAPLSGRTHLLLADVIAARGGTAQALFEVRLAAEYEPSLGAAAAARVARWATSFDEAMRAIPDGAFGTGILEDVAVQSKRPDIARRADEEVLRRDAARLGPRQREVFARLEALRSGGGDLCADKAKCEREIEEHCAVVERLDRDSSLAAQLRSELLVQQGRRLDAVQLLETACTRPVARSGCLMRLAAARAALGQTAELDATLKALTAEECGSPASCADAHTWVGNFREGRREMALAISSYRRAALDDPTEARWLRLADAAERGGQPSVVIEALEKVARRRGIDEELKRRIAAARARTPAHQVLP